MALTATLGLVNEKISKALPAKVDPKNALLVGVRAWETETIIERQKELGIESIKIADMSVNNNKVLEWLKNSGVSKVAIHFDLDVLDPNELTAVVAADPDGLKIDKALNIINDIAQNYDLVGLTVAEHLLRVAIKLQKILNNLPLLK